MEKHTRLLRRKDLFMIAVSFIVILSVCPKLYGASNFEISYGNSQDFEWMYSLRLGSTEGTGGVIELPSKDQKDAVGYYDGSAHSLTTVEAGEKIFYEIKMNSTSSYHQHIYFWLDVNQDGELIDDEERVHTTEKTVNGPTTHSGYFTVPEETGDGTVFGRVIMRFSSPPPLTGSYDYGTTFDFRIDVTGGVIYAQTDITVDVDGYGSVTSSPAGIDTTLSQTANFTQDREVEFAASGLSGFVFSHWSGAIEGSVNPSSLNTGSHEELALTAHFVPALSKPTVSAAPITDITDTTAQSGGSITDDGGSNVTQRGVVWSTEPSPTVDSCAGKTDDGSGTGSFSSQLDGLSPATEYYVRAYATNSQGTSYGPQESFSTQKSTQSINFDELSTRTYGADPFVLDATASSGLIISYESSDSDVATIDGSEVTIHNAGVTTITASQSGNDVYDAADAVTRMLTVSKAMLTITADDTSKVYGEDDPALTFKITEGELVGDDELSGAPERQAGEDAGSYDIMQGTLDAGDNYQISFVPGEFQVRPAEIVVRAHNRTRIYGDLDVRLTYDVVSVPEGLDFEFSGLLEREAGDDAGDYVIEQGSLHAGPNYQIAFEPGVFTIEARPLSVAANAHDKVYGDDDPHFTYRITEGALVSGDDDAVFQGTLSRAAGENVGEYVIEQGTLDAGRNYALDYEPGVFTIHPRPLVVKAQDYTKVYGEADPEYTHELIEGSLLDGDTVGGTLTRREGEDVGRYSLQAGTVTAGEDYQITFVLGELEITPRPLTVTAEPGEKTYGDVDPALDHTITEGSLVNGDELHGSLQRVAGDAVGEYPIEKGSLSAGGNYSLDFEGAAFAIRERPLTVTAWNVEKSGGTQLEFAGTEFDVDGLVFSDRVESVELRSDGAEVAAVVGEYDISIGQAVGQGLANYDVTYVAGTLRVTEQAQPVVTQVPESSELLYGQKLAEAQLSGGEARYNGQIVAGAFSFAKPDFVPPVGTGVYEASVIFVPKDTEQFSTVQQKAEVVVHPRELTITAVSQTKTYGRADRSLEYVLTEGELQPTDSLSGSLTREQGEDVGEYAILRGSLTAGNNYTIHFVPGEFSIQARAITVHAKDRAKEYGDEDPQWAYEVTEGSMVSGDTLSGELRRVPGEAVGRYAIRQGSLDVGSNYELTFVPGTFTIGQRVLTIAADDQTKVYGEIDPELTYAVVDGSLEEGDSIGGSLTRASGEDAGDYGIWQGTLSAGPNYAIAFEAGTLEITPAPLVVYTWFIQKSEGVEYVFQGNEFYAEGLQFYDQVLRVILKSDGAPAEALRGQYDVVPLQVELVTDQPNTGAMRALSDITMQGSRGLGMQNYVIEHRADVLEVTDAVTPTLVELPEAGTIVYGDSLEQAKLQGGRVEFDDEPVDGYFEVANPAFKPVVGSGSYEATVIFVPTDQETYNQVSGSIPVPVEQRGLQLSALPHTKLYGAADPKLGYVIDQGELVGNDSISGSPERDPGDLVGDYIIRRGTLNAGANYNLQFDTGVLTIKPREVYLDGLTIDSKPYDGTSEAQVQSFGDISGLMGADQVTLETQSANAAFASAQAGTQLVVVEGLSLSGDHAGNYYLAEAQVTSTIVPKDLTLDGLTVADKVYDGSTDAQATDWGTLSGIVGDDTVELDDRDAVARFVDPDIGLDKPVMITGLALVGAAAENYSVPALQVGAAILPPRPVIRTGVRQVEVETAYAGAYLELYTAEHQLLADYQLPAGDTSHTFSDISPGPDYYVLQTVNSAVSEPSNTVDVLASSDALLDDLAVSPGTLKPEFERTEMEYDVYVDKDADTLEITAVLADLQAELSIEGSGQDSGVSRSVQLEDAGSRTRVEIVVTAEDGSREEYILTVYRAPVPVEFYVTEVGEPLGGALIGLGETAGSTDAQGRVVLEKAAGTYEYFVHRPGYKPESGIIEVGMKPLDVGVEMTREQYSVTAAISPEGSGTVQMTPDKETHAFEDTIELEAKPSEGYTFLGWSMADAKYTDNPLTVVVTDDIVVDAHFHPTRDVELEITILNAPLRPGDTLEALVTVRNSGAIDLKDIDIEVYLSSFLFFSGASDQGVYDPEQHSISWRVKELPAADDLLCEAAAASSSSVSFGLHGIIDQEYRSEEGPVVLEGVATDPLETVQGSAATETTVEDVPELVVTLRADRDEAVPGDVIRYTVTYANRGTVSIDDVMVKLKLPDSVQVLADEGRRVRKAGIPWALGTLSPQERDSFEIDVVVDDPLPYGSQTLTAQVEATAAQLDDAVHSREAEVTVVAGYLRLDVEILPQDVEIGDRVTVRATLRNVSEDLDAEDVQYSAQVPDGFAYVADSVTLEEGILAEPEQATKPSWVVGDLPPGTSRTIRYQLRVTTEAQAGFHYHQAEAAGKTSGGHSMQYGPVRTAVLVLESVLSGKGLIVGQVFRDIHGTGRFDDGDEPVPHVRLVMSNGWEIITDEYGRYSIPGVNPGVHGIVIDPRSLPEELRAEAGRTHEIRVPRGGIVRVILPLQEQK